MRGKFQFSWELLAKVVASIAVGTIIYAVVIGSLGAIRAYDGFWHLAMGRDFLKHGMSPFVDHYSFSYLGSSIFGTPVPYQFVLGLFDSFFGFPESYLYSRMLFGLLPLIVLGFFFVRHRVDWRVAVFVFTLCGYLLSLKQLLRPELTAFTFGVLMVHFCVVAREKPNFQSLIPIVVLQAVWTPIHISSTIGFVLAGSLFVNILFTEIRGERSFRKMFLFSWMGILTLLTGFLFPSFDHPLYHLATVDRRWNDLIVEHVERPFADFPWVFRAYRTMMVAFLIYWIRSGNVFGALITLVFFYQGWSLSKINSHFIFYSSPFVAIQVTQWIRNADVLRLRSSVRYAVASVLVFCFGYLVFEGFKVSRIINQTPLLSHDYRAVYPLSYLRLHGRHKLIFNTHPTGGFLGYFLGPVGQIYIDGRSNILYPYHFVSNFVRAEVSPSNLHLVLAEHNPDYLLQKTDYYHVRAGVLTGHSPIAGSTRTVLMERSSEMLPAWSRLMIRPDCWGPQYEIMLPNEYERLKSDGAFSSSSHTLISLRFFSEYLKAEDRSDFLVRSKVSMTKSSYLLSVLAQISYKEGRLEESLGFLDSIAFEERRIDNYILMLEILVRLERLDLAVDILNSISLSELNSLRDVNYLRFWPIVQKLLDFSDDLKVDEKRLKAWKTSYEEAKLKEKEFGELLDAFCDASKEFRIKDFI